MVSPTRATVRSAPVRERVRVSAVGAAAALAALVLAARDPAAGGFPRCPVNALSGWWCPGCGSQRGLHALLTGDLAGAVGSNALMVAAVPFLAYAYGAWVLRAFGVAAVASPDIGPRALRWLPALVASFAVVRNLPFGQALAP